MPRTADGKPDLNGSWNLPYTPNMAKDIGELPFTAEGKAAYGKINTAYDPTGFCLFPGVPRINNSPFPMRVVQSADSVVFLYEYMTTFRAVPLDKCGSIPRNRIQRSWASRLVIGMETRW